MNANRFRAELTHELSTLVTCAVAGATENAHAARPHSDTPVAFRRLRFWLRSWTPPQVG